MAAIGAPDALLIGGKTASGPKSGIYHVQVTNVTTGASEKTGTKFIELELTVKNDKNHPEREGKVLLKQRHWLANPTKDAESQAQAMGRLKSSLFKPFGATWPKEQKAFDKRGFLNKEMFVLVAKEKKPQEGYDARAEVRRYAAKAEDLEKLAATIVESGDEGGDEGADEAKPAKKAAASGR